MSEDLLVRIHKSHQTCVFDAVNIFSTKQQALSLVSLVDFLGKIEENRVRKVLCVAGDEFLEALVASLFIFLVQ